MTFNIKKKRKTINRDMDFNNSSRWFRPLDSRVMALPIKCDSLASIFIATFIAPPFLLQDNV